MSFTFLRTWYQVSDTSFGPVEPFRYTKTVDCPALVKLFR